MIAERLKIVLLALACINVLIFTIGMVWIFELDDAQNLANFNSLDGYCRSQGVNLGGYYKYMYKDYYLTNGFIVREPDKVYHTVLYFQIFSVIFLILSIVWVYPIDKNRG